MAGTVLNDAGNQDKVVRVPYVGVDKSTLD
jgi:hypothetical protein